MNVLVTGAYGRCGTALIDHLDDRYDFTCLNRSDRPPDHPYGGHDTVVADVADAAALSRAAVGQAAVVHLAGYPYTDGTWSDVLEPNVVGTYNALEAAREREVGSFVFASSNHVMGGYELERAPEIYRGEHDLALSAADPVRPDSHYGTSKAMGEALCRQYAELYDYPERVYALRICSVRMPEYDHPYGDAERGVEDGEFDRGSREYADQVGRMQATWQSRRDFAHQVACCLDDDGVDFGIYAGVSDNLTRWYSIERARVELGYDPRDDGSEWDAPPA